MALRGEWPVVPGLFFGAGGGALLWNHLLGPGCRAYLMTGVQTTVLPSLVRMNKARKVLQKLAPQIAAIQWVQATPAAPEIAVALPAPPPDVPPAPPPVA
jgi:hypothetical protein